MPPTAHGSQGEISKIDALLTPRKLALSLGWLKAGTDLWHRFERAARCRINVEKGIGEPEELIRTATVKALST